MYVGAAVKDEQGILAKLGKYKTGKGCLYINKLEDIDVKALQKIVYEKD